MYVIIRQKGSNKCEVIEMTEDQFENVKESEKKEHVKSIYIAPAFIVNAKSEESVSEFKNILQTYGGREG